MIQKPQGLNNQNKKFFMWYGVALAQWQSIEWILYLITHAILKTQSDYSSIVFFHIQSPSAKITLVDKLIRAAVPKEIIEKDWKLLLKRLRSATDDRNKLAHHMPSPTDETAGGTPTKYALMPHMLNFSRERGKPIPADKLQEIAHGFEALTLDLWRFIGNRL